MIFPILIIFSNKIQNIKPNNAQEALQYIDTILKNSHCNTVKECKDGIHGFLRFQKLGKNDFKNNGNSGLKFSGSYNKKMIKSGIDNVIEYSYLYYSIDNTNYISGKLRARINNLTQIAKTENNVFQITLNGYKYKAYLRFKEFSFTGKGIAKSGTITIKYWNWNTNKEYYEEKIYQYNKSPMTVFSY